MEQQTYTQTGNVQGDKPDRTMTITVTPTLVWYSSTPPYNIQATRTFSLTSSTPDMTGRVHADGDIILHPLPSTQDYSGRVDITFVLDTSQLKDPNGNPVQGRWAQSGEGNGYCWFCNVTNVSQGQYDTTPITVPNFDHSGLTLRTLCRSLPTAFSSRPVIVRASQPRTVSDTSRTIPSP